MRKRLATLVGIAILLLWGGVMIAFYVSGRIVVYLTGEFRTFALLAGFGLVVLALFNLLTMRANVGDGHHHDHDHDHDHGDDDDHDHVTPALGVVPLLILIVPLVAAARLSPDAFSERVVMNKGLYDIVDASSATVGKSVALERPAPPVDGSSEPDGGVDVDEGVGSGANGEMADGAPAEEEWEEYTLADLEAQVEKTADGNFLLTVPQLFYTAGDEELQRVVETVKVEAVAQVMPEKVNNPDGTRLRIFRLFVECCAADARPLSIPAEFGAEPPEYQEMGWVKVVGTMSYVEEDGITVPLLMVESMEETEEPEDAFMF
ncbi:MAG: DUF1980 domain-containing protein [Verrucomicrobiota bacterium]